MRLRGPFPFGFGAVLTWAALSLAALAVVLAGLTIDRAPTVEAASSNMGRLWPFWIASASGWASLTVLWLLIRGRPPASRALRPVLVILGVAVAARAAVIAAHDPGLSDDVYRYVFDGRNLAHGINPYMVMPVDRLDGPEHWPGEHEVVDSVNNPQLHTIYLPASQLVFAAAGLVIPDAWSGPAASARVVRMVMVAFEVAAIGLLLVALARLGRSPWWAALYAWHPLALTEIAGSGHQESLGIAILLAAILVAGRALVPVWRWAGLLALAALVKPIVLPVAAFLLKGHRPWTWVRAIAVGAVVCLAVAAPLWLTHGGRPLGNALETAQRFTLKWAHFGGVYEPLLTAIEWVRPTWTNDQQEVLARRICLAALAAVILGAWLRRKPYDDQRHIWADTRIIFFAMVLLSPAAHPWYLLWALAMMPMAPSPAVWVASLTLPWGYAAWAHVTPDGTPKWGTSPFLMTAAYAPIYAALIVDIGRRCVAAEAQRRAGIPAGH